MVISIRAGISVKECFYKLRECREFNVCIFHIKKFGARQLLICFILSDIRDGTSINFFLSL